MGCVHAGNMWVVCMLDTCGFYFCGEYVNCVNVCVCVGGLVFLTDLAERVSSYDVPVCVRAHLGRVVWISAKKNEYSSQR